MNRAYIFSIGNALRSLLLLGAALGSSLAAEELVGLSKARPTKVVSVPLQTIFEKAADTRIKSPFQSPRELIRQQDDGSFDLNLGTGKFPSPDVAEVDPTIPSVFERLCYNGEPVGPTIRTRPNDHFRIWLRNSLIGRPDFVPGPVDGVPGGEKPHGLGTTNLHTHGLHVRPDGNSDNIFQSIDPGDSLKFQYRLKDHPAGTFWYHPHKHGSVAYQLSNGVSGALIIEGDPNNPNDLESIPEIAAASTWSKSNEADNHERIVVLQLFTYRIGSDGIGRIDASQIYNVPPDANSAEPIVVTGDPLPPDSQPLQVTAINGVINPTFTIAPGEVQRWRLIHAGWDQLRQLVWVDDNDKATEDIQFNEIAIDGLATGTMTVQNPLQIAPGQRSDALIWANPLINEGKTYHLKQLAVSAALATHNRPVDANYLARLVVTGDSQSMSLPDLSNPSTVTRLASCRPFKSVQDSELSGPSFLDGTVPGTLNFLGSDAIQTYTINGQTFHQARAVQLNIGTAEEWTLNALLGNHPFHIHVNPFQVVSYKDPTGKVRAMDMWRDTLYVPEGASYTIRSRFRDFIGDSVLHCHILDHEDQGMMLCLRFKDPRNPENMARGPGCPVQELTACNVPAPIIALTDIVGKQHDLSARRPRPMAIVFMRGLRCQHCVARLRQFLSEAEQSGFDGDLIAVSADSASNEEVATALRGLELRHFHFAVDEEHSLFRSFGCYRGNDICHGLFLLDCSGKIRAAYTGAAPYANPKDVIVRARDLN